MEEEIEAIVVEVEEQVNLQENQSSPKEEEEEEELTSSTLEFEKVSLPDVALFVIDTETTGSQGVPFWYSQNQVIQLAMFDLENNSWYERYTFPGERLEPGFNIPLENQQKHRISKKVLFESGVPLKQALEESREFKLSSAKGRKIINIAHNAQFDYEMLMKSYTEQCDESFGVGCQEDEEYYFDTLAAFKHFYPEVGMKVHQREAPYKLSNLAKYFLPDLNMQAAHNAIVDTIATALLFSKFLFPKLGPDTRTWSRFFVCHPLYGSSSQKPIPRLTRLIDIDGYSELRVKRLTEVCNRFFGSFHEEEINQLQCSEGMITAATLLSYGHVKCIMEKQERDSEAKRRNMMLYGKADLEEGEEEEILTGKKREPKENFLGYDSYFEICRVLEKLLRSETFGIYSDKVICALLSKVCNTTLLDFTLHTYRLDGETPLFPTMPGEPISYLPLSLSEDEASYINDVMHCATISEMYAQMKYLDNSELLGWIQLLNRGLHEPISAHTLQLHFDNVIKYGG
jgi:DNA polymerase III epsilon subunit-like protein